MLCVDMPTLKWVRRPKSGASGAAAAAGGESARRAAAAVPDPVVSAAAEAVPDSAVSASSGTCASGTTTTPAVSPGIVGENWTTPLMVPTDEGDANLSLFLGGAAANHTDEEFPTGCILYKVAKGSGSSRRLYLSKNYTKLKDSVDALKKVIQESAMRSNVPLCAAHRKDGRIRFYCPHKKNCKCKMHFTLHCDPEMSRWYLIEGSGHPEHIPHERGQPPRKNAKRKLTQVALQQHGLASSDFGDAATQRIVTAAAVALCKNAKRSRV